VRAIPSPCALFIVSALAAAGCGAEGEPSSAPSPAIEATIVITTDFDCSLLNDVTIDLLNKDGIPTTVASTDQCSNRSVGSLVFVPGEGTDKDTFFIVVVTAGLERPASLCEANGFAGCVVARRRMTFSSTPENILLRSECASVPCSFATTCVSGGECAPFTNP
jgi:hypothetical protein